MVAKKQTKTQKIWTIILNVILGIFILIGIIVLFSLIPFKGNYKIYSVMSGSMVPAIKTGAMVFVKPADNYQKNDIITFKSGARKLDITTHRIIEIEKKDQNTTYITKGDANEETDYDRIDSDKIIGKVVSKINYLGYILGYIKTLPGLILIIIIPATIIIYEEFKKVREEAIRIVRERAKKKSRSAINSKK